MLESLQHNMIDRESWIERRIEIEKSIGFGLSWRKRKEYTCSVIRSSTPLIVVSVSVSVSVSEYRHQIMLVSKLPDTKISVSVSVSESTDTKNVGVGVGGKTMR